MINVFGNMKKAVFDKLKYGDKLAAVNHRGEYDFFTYLCKDPGRKEDYAFLMESDGIHARHFNNLEIENMYLYEDLDEFKKFVREIKATYYRAWLECYDNDKLNKYEV